MQWIARTVQPAVWTPVAHREDTAFMVTTLKIALLLGTLSFSLTALVQEAGAPGQGPEYTIDAQLRLPVHYRDWIYLTTGFDMSYNPSMQMSGHHMFDNVFVNPDAYQAFL